MGNLGGGEIVVILLVALLVLGPNKLPEAARQIGRAMGELRKVTSGFQRELQSALNEADESDARRRGDAIAATRPAPAADPQPAADPAALLPPAPNGDHPAPEVGETDAAAPGGG